MDINEIINVIAQVRNTLASISVNGDDAIRMAQALSMLRELFGKLQEESNNNLEHAES